MISAGRRALILTTRLSLLYNSLADCPLLMRTCRDHRLSVSMLAWWYFATCTKKKLLLSPIDRPISSQAACTFACLWLVQSALQTCEFGAIVSSDKSCEWASSKEENRTGKHLLIANEIDIGRLLASVKPLATCSSSDTLSITWLADEWFLFTGTHWIASARSTKQRNAAPCTSLLVRTTLSASI